MTTVGFSLEMKAYFENVPEAEKEVLDPETIEGLHALSAGEEEDVLGEVIALYQTHAPELLGAARQALGAQDARALREAAHSLRGSSAQFGAPQMQQACAELELAAHANVLHRADVLFAAVEREFQRLVSALRTLRAVSMS